MIINIYSFLHLSKLRIYLLYYAFFWSVMVISCNIAQLNFGLTLHNNWARLFSSNAINKKVYIECVWKSPYTRWTQEYLPECFLIAYARIVEVTYSGLTAIFNSLSNSYAMFNNCELKLSCKISYTNTLLHSFL